MFSLILIGAGKSPILTLRHRVALPKGKTGNNVDNRLKPPGGNTLFCVMVCLDGYSDRKCVSGLTLRLFF